MEIKVFNTDRMRNDACFQFNTEVLALIDLRGAQTLKILTPVSKFRDLLAKLDTVIKKIIKSSITEQIKNTDKLRDDAHFNIQSTVNNGLKHFSPEVQTAAKELKILMDTYGNIRSKPYNEQSSATTNLIQDLRSDKYKNCVALLQLRAWVDQMEIQNNQVIELVKERDLEKSVKPSDDVKEVRKDLDEAYRTVVRSINGLYAAEETDIYKKLIIDINLVIDRYKKMIAQSKPRKKEGE